MDDLPELVDESDEETLPPLRAKPSAPAAAAATPKKAAASAPPGLEFLVITINGKEYGFLGALKYAEELYDRKERAAASAALETLMSAAKSKFGESDLNYARCVLEAFNLHFWCTRSAFGNSAERLASVATIFRQHLGENSDEELAVHLLQATWAHCHTKEAQGKVWLAKRVLSKNNGLQRFQKDEPSSRHVAHLFPAAMCMLIDHEGHYTTPGIKSAEDTTSCYTTALEFARTKAMKDPSLLFRVLTAFGAHLVSTRPDQAEAYLREADQIFVSLSTSLKAPNSRIQMNLNAVAHEQLGKLLLMKKNTKEAEEVFERALRLGDWADIYLPDLTNICSLYLQMLVTTKRFKDAVILAEGILDRVDGGEEFRPEYEFRYWYMVAVKNLKE